MPTNMTWTPATITESLGERVDLRIQGGLDAPGAEGDFIVLVRASADSGLTWTECDLDGSQNGTSPTQALGLHVGATAPATTTPAPASDCSAPTTSEESTDDSSSSKSSEKDDSESETTLPGKKAAAGGCSVSQPSTASASGFSAAGLLLGLAALALAAARRADRWGARRHSSGGVRDAALASASPSPSFSSALAKSSGTGAQTERRAPVAACTNAIQSAWSARRWSAYASR